MPVLAVSLLGASRARAGPAQDVDALTYGPQVIWVTARRVIALDVVDDPSVLDSSDTLLIDDTDRCRARAPDRNYSITLLRLRAEPWPAGVGTARAVDARPDV